VSPPRPRLVPAVVPPSAPPERALWFAFAGSDLLVAERGGGDAPFAVPVARDLAALGLAPVRTQYLGTLDGAACFSAELAHGTAPPPGHQLLGIRALYGRMDPTEFDLAGTAFQVQHWDRTHLFCAVDGTALEARAHERAKRCPRCERDYFPRLSPCAIVLVHDGPRVLLTRQPRFPQGMYGLVAGFVEAGETLEECAAREVREETGLEVEDVRYFGSQPWPFPHQVMVGFFARHAGGTLTVDTTELEEARWFDASAMPQLPPRLSIARQMIDAFLRERAGGAREP
jgi:NAD+ diphosphatase